MSATTVRSKLTSWHDVDLLHRSKVEKIARRDSSPIRGDKGKNVGPFKCAITITAGDRVENHVGNQQIGTMAKEGFTVGELETIHARGPRNGLQTELIALNAYAPAELNTERAAVLIIRGGVDALLRNIDENSVDLYEEHAKLEWDTKARMYGAVRNKHARHNLCYAKTPQKADYENGKGTVVAFDTVPILDFLMCALIGTLGEKAVGLHAEGNKYYDPSTTGIGFHGDAERKRVVAIRLGASIPLHYQWFHEGSPVGERVRLSLDHGDIYVMSEKATGNDWKRKKVPTLRHAAGCAKYTTIKPKQKK